MTFRYEQISDKDWNTYIQCYEDRDPSSPGNRWWSVNEDRSCFLRKIRSHAPESPNIVRWQFYCDGDHHWLITDCEKIERRDNWRKVYLKVSSLQILDLATDKNYVGDYIEKIPIRIRESVSEAFQGYRFGVSPEREFSCEYVISYS